MRSLVLSSGIHWAILVTINICLIIGDREVDTQGKIIALAMESDYVACVDIYSREQVRERLCIIIHVIA